MNKKKLILGIILLVVCIPMGIYGWHLETTQGTDAKVILLLFIGVLVPLAVIVGTIRGLLDKLVDWFHK